MKYAVQCRCRSTTQRVRRCEIPGATQSRLTTHGFYEWPRNTNRALDWFFLNSFVMLFICVMCASIIMGSDLGQCQLLFALPIAISPVVLQILCNLSTFQLLLASRSILSTSAALTGTCSRIKYLSIVRDRRLVPTWFSMLVILQKLHLRERQVRYCAICQRNGLVSPMYRFAHSLDS